MNNMTKEMKINTLDSVSIERLIRQMQSDKLEQLMTLNDNEEVVKVELYKENESTIEPKEHLRYIIYHDNGLETEWLFDYRSEEHTSELQSRFDFVCRLLLENNI